MKIAIVSQYYSPEPVGIPHTLAEVLVARGHDVRVVTGYPNYPTARLADGYRMRLNDVATIGGVDVRRVPLAIDRRRSALGRIVNYLSFAVSSTLVGRWVRNADVVYVYATPMTAAVGPWIWRVIYRVPFVLHVQDLWPESVTHSAMAGGGTFRSIATIVLAPWLRSLYRSSAAILAISSSMRHELIERGANHLRTETVFNWATPEPTHPLDREDDPSDCVTVVYAGNFGEHQDLGTLVRAAKMVEDVSNLRIRLVGSGVEESALRELARELGVSNLEFLGRVPPADMARVHYDSDFQVVILKDLQIFRSTIPSKLQAALSAGKPVISSVPGDVTRLIKENGLGLTSDPEKPESLAAALRAAAALPADERRAMSRRARDYYVKTMSKESSVTHIESVLEGARRPQQTGEW